MSERIRLAAKRNRLLLAALPLFVLLSACLDNSQPPESSRSIPQETSASGTLEPTPTPAATDKANEPPAYATLLAVGDIMVHMPQLPAYYDPSTDQYDFSPWFARTAPILQKGDWVIGNLETPLAGADLKYTGYPRFNAPAELADALHGAGFDLVSTANNHSLDRGFAGVQQTLDHVRKAGLIPVGTAASPEEAEQLTIVERNGIRMGFLAYTYGTNGIPMPEDKPYAVSHIDLDRMAQDIGRLREAGADVVTVSVHFGVEYQKLPNDEQRSIARFLIGSGADIVLGSHPHVVQPYEMIEIPASESPLLEERKGIVIYSLGNFISNQTGDGKDVGLIFGMRLMKIFLEDGRSVTVLDSVELSPTWVHIVRKNGKRHYTIQPLRQALAERNDPALTEAEYQRMEKMLADMDRHLHTYQKK